MIFIGEDFYFESGTMMSSIYTTDGKRFDWGFVKEALREGKNVSIRPATDEERKPYEKELAARKVLAGGT